MREAFRSSPTRSLSKCRRQKGPLPLSPQTSPCLDCRPSEAVLPSKSPSPALTTPTFAMPADATYVQFGLDGFALQSVSTPAPEPSELGISAAGLAILIGLPVFGSSPHGERHGAEAMPTVPTDIKTGTLPGGVPAGIRTLIWKTPAGRNGASRRRGLERAVVDAHHHGIRRLRQRRGRRQRPALMLRSEVQAQPRSVQRHDRARGRGFAAEFNETILIDRGRLPRPRSGPRWRCPEPRRPRAS